MMTIRFLAVAALLALAAGDAVAQQREAPPAERRAMLERRFQQQMGAMLRERLQLTDAQLRQLTETNARFEQRRRTLVMQERETRVGLRRELMRGEQADEGRISQLMDRTFELQRRRLALIEEEQRALAEFLSPRQRAMFMAMQEQIRHRAEEMRRGRLQGGGERPGGPPRRPPPGGGPGY